MTTTRTSPNKRRDEQKNGTVRELCTFLLRRGVLCAKAGDARVNHDFFCLAVSVLLGLQIKNAVLSVCKVVSFKGRIKLETPPGWPTLRV